MPEPFVMFPAYVVCVPVTEFEAIEAEPPTSEVINEPLLPLRAPIESDWPLRSNTPEFSVAMPLPRAVALPAWMVPDWSVVPPL